MVDHPTPTPESLANPVEPKHAASLLVLRGGAEPEVLMGLRGAGHKFMPNRLVFPGGRVDDADFTTPHAAPLHPNVAARLQTAATAELASALAQAAARELQEETGLTMGAPPALDGLDYLCRAVTPAASPIRFDARFLVIDAERISGTVGGDGELEDLRWYGVQEAIGLDLAFATKSVLTQLLGWLDMPAEQRLLRSATPLMQNRGWTLA